MGPAHAYTGGNIVETKTGLATIAKFFGIKGKEALAQVRALTDEDKAQLATGIADGTLTY